jgi:hypothetical protein
MAARTTTSSLNAVVAVEAEVAVAVVIAQSRTGTKAHQEVVAVDARVEN